LSKILNDFIRLNRQTNESTNTQMKIVQNIFFLRYFSIFLVLISGFISKSFSQITQAGSLDGNQNVITTAVPFLMISPDARSAGLGDAGVAMPDDINGMHWNLAKFPFYARKGAVSLSYTPWLRQLVPDISLAYLTAYIKSGERSAIAGSLRFFSLGQIQFTDQTGQSLGNYTPSEFAIDLGYSSKLSDNFSLGVGLRYIYSNLAGGFNQSQSPIEPGVAYAGDIAAYYTNKTRLQGYKVDYSIGLTTTNIGSKITYTSAQFENFIPINLRLGGYANMEIDKYNTIALLLDFNKLMIPSNPIYLKRADGRFDSLSTNGKRLILKGMDPNVPVVQGMLQSFYDAPGGFSEELQEINISTGLEYWYDKQFAMRAGYFHEPYSKGNRRYLTLGTGIRYNVFGLDVAYLWPFQQRHPLENTLRFSLIFDFEAFASQQKEEKKTPKVPGLINVE